MTIALATAVLAGCSPTPEESAARHRSTIDAFCTDCHNDVERVADLSLERLDLANVGEHGETWEKVVRKLRAGMMPPPDGRRPEWSIRETLVKWIETELDLAAPASTRGAPALRRLNRTEYENAIRDLLALDIDVASLLPPDDSAYGFDNVAGSLGVSSALLERYLAAAARISALAVGGVAGPSETTYSVPVDRTQDYHVEGLPFGTRGGALIEHHFPQTGEYVVSIELLRDYNGVLFGDPEGERLEVSVDGERVRLFDLEQEATSGFTEHEPLQVRVPISAGPRQLGVTFAKSSYASVQDAFQPFQRSTVSLSFQDRTLRPHLGSVTIIGPHLADARIGDTPSRRRIFVCRPDADEERPCAEEIVSTLAYRAFRRPVADAELDLLMTFYEAGREKGGFEDGIEMALRRILASPKFVFRYERAAAGSENSGAPVPIDAFELASRLSFFLWSSIPDEELLELAAGGALLDRAHLERQVERMLADRRFERFIRNFAGQWLYLRNLDEHAPGLEQYPDFDDNLRQAFRRETELLFESIVSEDRSVLDLLTADYTFVNERLARHYEIPDIRGSHFRRVALPSGSPRRGLLGHGSILTVTSYATRTSPVIRGKWILENILGMAPPEPPPDVSQLEEEPSNVREGEILSVRERLKAHLVNPSCAGCHIVMDPIGLALENFDGVGRWRTHERNVPIDASTELVDGTPLEGPASLRDALVHRYSEQFVRTMTEKLLTYALGRGLDHSDMPLVRSIVREAAERDYRFSALMTAIVTSGPFLQRDPGSSATGPAISGRWSEEDSARDDGG